MDTQQQILAAALRLFASRGYAGTSVQDIVAAARVTKPALYYYFANKAALYQALVTSAHEERYRLMRAAAKRGVTLEQQLVEILTALFDYTRDHRELMRLAFTTAFASPDELPDDLDYLSRSQRNFDFMNALVKKGLQTGVLDRRFDSKELAFGVYGLMNVYVMAHLMMPDCKLDRSTARHVVQLFLSGAAAKKPSPKRAVKRRKS
jgi:TetR/AcrR family transcriptional regulator